MSQYLNPNSNGWDGGCVSETIGSEPMATFANWLRTNGKKVFLGEFGVLDNATAQMAPPTTALIAEALASRPEVAIAGHAEKIADARADAEGAGLWPQICLRIGYNYARPNQRYFLLATDLMDHGTCLSCSRGRSGMRNADDVRESVRFDVERRRQEYESIRERTKASRQAVLSTEKAFELATSLFAEGRITRPDLLDAETEVTRARSEHIQVLADSRITWAMVVRAVGRGR